MLYWINVRHRQFLGTDDNEDKVRRERKEPAVESVQLSLFTSERRLSLPLLQKKATIITQTQASPESLKPSASDLLL